MYYCSPKCSISWQRLWTVDSSQFDTAGVCRRECESPHVSPACLKRWRSECMHRWRNPWNSLRRSSTPISGYWRKITYLYPPALRWLFGHVPITPGGLPLEIASFFHHNSDHIISHQQSLHQHVYAYIYGCLNTVSVFYCVYVRGS